MLFSILLFKVGVLNKHSEGSLIFDR